MPTCRIWKYVRLFFFDIEQFFFHFIHDSFFPQIVLVDAAHFQVDFINSPVVQVITKWHDAHFINYMEFSVPIEVQNAFETSRVNIKEIFIIDKWVGITTRYDFFMGEGQR